MYNNNDNTNNTNNDNYQQKNIDKALDKNLNKLNRDFFDSLSNYIDEDIYFYGSVLRSDFNKKSDIDIGIFTNNIESVIMKLSNFLQINPKKFKKVYWKMPKTNNMVFGNKVVYKNKKNGINAEISIYDKKHKDEILSEYYKKTNIPIHGTILLYILKFLYYDLGIIDSKNYIYLKQIILSYGIGYDLDKFVAI